MLECTWNDTEAEIALRRLLLKEQENQKHLANDPQLRQKIRESALFRLASERIQATGFPSRDTL